MITLEKFQEEVGALKEPLTQENIVAVVLHLMKLVGHIRGVKGSQKKALVMGYIEKNMKGSNVPSLEFISDLIDTFVFVENGKAKINGTNILKTIAGCFGF